MTSGVIGQKSVPRVRVFSPGAATFVTCTDGYVGVIVKLDAQALRQNGPNARPLATDCHFPRRGTENECLSY